MDIALQTISFSQQRTGKELEALLRELCEHDALLRQLHERKADSWTVDVHEALLDESRVRMLGTCPVRQTSDSRDDHLLTPRELAKSTLITPDEPDFDDLNRAGLYLNPNTLYSHVFIWSFQRSVLTPTPDRYAAQAFVRYLARKLELGHQK